MECILYNTSIESEFWQEYYIIHPDDNTKYYTDDTYKNTYLSKNDDGSKLNLSRGVLPENLRRGPYAVVELVLDFSNAVVKVCLLSWTVVLQ